MDNYFHHKRGRIFYTDRGYGIPVVLIHGYLETSAVWEGFADKLANKNRVIAIDLPGHGKSDLLGEIHTMDFMADVIRQLLVSSETGPVFMTGHSMGGYITLAFADLFPAMLSGYCLFHSHPLADSPEVLKKREMEIRLVRTGNKDKMFPDSISRLFAKTNLGKYAGAIECSKRIAATIPPDGINAVLKGMMKRPSRIGVMESGNLPLLWILGAMDNHIDCEKIQARIRVPHNTEVVILENSGHMGFIEERESSLEAIESFINKTVKIPDP